MTTYTDSHRSFLQHLTSRRLLTAPQVNAAYEFTCAKYEVDPSANGGLRQFVMTINAELSQLHLTIRKSVQEDLRADKSCFVLINTITSNSTKPLTTLAPWEETLFERIVDAIVLSDKGYINEIDAINMGPEIQGHRVSVSESEASVKKMVANMRLNKNDNVLLLSALTLSEQHQLLEDKYPDSCVKCAICKVITILGYNCDKCDVRVHRSCGLNLWRKAKRNAYCPSCQTNWDSVGGDNQK